MAPSPIHLGLWVSFSFGERVNEQTLDPSVAQPLSMQSKSNGMARNEMKLWVAKKAKNENRIHRVYDIGLQMTYKKCTLCECVFAKTQCIYYTV